MTLFMILLGNIQAFMYETEYLGAFMGVNIREKYPHREEFLDEYAIYMPKKLL